MNGKGMRGRRLRTVWGGALPALVLAATGVCRGEVIYCNDFSQRTSADPVPRAAWFEKNYAWGVALSYGYGEGSGYSSNSPYENPARIQDGWVKIRGGSSTYGKQLVNFWVRADQDSANPMGVFYNQSGKYGSEQQLMVVHPLYNAFSNGVVRFSADLRSPGLATPGGSYFRVKPVCATGMSPGCTSFARYALAFGPSDAGTKLQIVGSDGQWGGPTASAGVSFESPTRSHWYRYVVDLDLDASTYTGAIYDLGTSQPTPVTPTPATKIAGTGSNKMFLYRRVADLGPIAGIGLHTQYASAYALKSSTDNTLVFTNAPCADNLRVWWKPTGRAADFGADDLVYENTFSTRRYRCLGGTTSSTATSDTLAVPTSDTYAYRDACSTNQVLERRNFVEPGKTGCDGWKPPTSDAWGGNGNCALVDMKDAGGNALAFATDAGFAKFFHPIGQSLASGKVKLEGDLRLPNKWSSTSSCTFTLCLGDDTLATTVNSGYAIRVGISGVSSKTNFYPYAYASDSATRSATDVALTPNTWYRVRVTADLSSRTYDYELYELGTAAGGFDRTVPATPVYSRTGIGFCSANDLTEFTTLAIYAYMSGTTWQGSEVVDNIRISTGTDGVNWTTVYQNDFTTRVRYGARTTPEAKLLNADVNRVGLDGWVRRGKYIADWLVRDHGNGNPCLAFEDEMGVAHAQNMLGKPVVNGRLKVRVDMRPPIRYTSYSEQIGRVYVGGDEYAQGEIGTNVTSHAALRSFMNAAVGYFGFTRSGNASLNGYYSQVQLQVYDAAGSQKDYVISGDNRSNWYRFLATFDLNSQTWQVDVFNQGTTQPTVDSPNGTLVKSFQNLVFSVADPAGISAFGLAAGASCGSQLHLSDTLGLLVDNLVIEKVPSGSILVIR